MDSPRREEVRLDGWMSQQKYRNTNRLTHSFKSGGTVIQYIQYESLLLKYKLTNQVEIQKGSWKH